MPRLTCTSCGAQYPANWRKAWGLHPETHGHGPAMKCTALVPNGLIAPVPPDKSELEYPLERRTAMQVCGGDLTIEKADPSPEAPVWPAS